MTATPPRLSLGVVIVTRDRAQSLERTLHELAAIPETGLAPIVVVDNGSSSPHASRNRAACAVHPHARLVDAGGNLGVASFNLGARSLNTDTILILDDDAWPESGAVAAALALLASRPNIAAVALHPHHPRTRRSEWPFVASSRSAAVAPRGGWPFLQCGNLIRHADYLAAGGYEPAYFLYSNDTDLALKLLARGRDVWFDPAWIVWHDCPTASHRPLLWCRLATRNRIWTARRHLGPLRGRWIGILAAGAALRVAGLSPRRALAVTRGMIEGMTGPAPPLPATVPRDRRGFTELLRLARRRGV
ncbi:MAG: glycosyltransferase [Phycisphaerae bacterium]|nr:glycosyltransferase [Phycisphaerae bacterium]